MSTDVSKFPVLVVGSGSIGRRHMRNLRSLGIQAIAACDVEQKRLEPMVQELGVRAFDNFDEALTKTCADVVFVCTPPVFHVPQALAAVEAGAQVFIEKPLSNSLEGVDALLRIAEAKKKVIQVGYNIRFHPGLLLLRKLMEEDRAIGKVFWAQAEYGQFLPDWRPWQDYRRSYTAKMELGGGIILDASHELDYILWLFGLPVEVACMADRLSALGVDVEDSATILLRFSNGARADIHVDFVQRPYSRSCKLVGEKGTLYWDYPGRKVKVFRTEQSRWHEFPYPFEGNDMYVAEVKQFFDAVKGRQKPIVDMRTALNVLKVALAAREASRNKSLVRLDWSGKDIC